MTPTQCVNRYPNTIQFIPTTTQPPANTYEPPTNLTHHATDQLGTEELPASVFTEEPTTEFSTEQSITTEPSTQQSTTQSWTDQWTTETTEETTTTAETATEAPTTQSPTAATVASTEAATEAHTTGQWSTAEPSTTSSLQPTTSEPATVVTQSNFVYPGGGIRRHALQDKFESDSDKAGISDDDDSDDNYREDDELSEEFLRVISNQDSENEDKASESLEDGDDEWRKR